VELWLVITIAAAFAQNVRSLLQRRLIGDLSVNGAAYLRFLYAVPFAWVFAFWLWEGAPEGFTREFFAYVLVAAVAQIVATACLLASFGTGNFAVGTAFSKTEAAQAAIFGLLVLGDGLSVWVFFAIVVSLMGVVLLSGQLHWREILQPNRAMWLGLAAGAGFALSAVGFRGASLALAEGDFFHRAVLTVMVSVSLQTLLMGVYLILREPGQLRLALGSWRVAIWIGCIGMLASTAWFSAMTLTTAAVVRAVGQIELVFTVITSVWLLGERLRTKEVVGMVLVVFGIGLLLLD